MMTSLMADMYAVFVVRVKFSIPSDSAKATVQDPVTDGFTNIVQEPYQSVQNVP